MAALIALDPFFFDSCPPSSPFTIRGVIGLEGIYDIPLMISDFPNYLEWVVTPAFRNDKQHFVDVSPTHLLVNKPPSASQIDQIFPKWLVVHAEADELLKSNQSTGFAENLKVQDPIPPDLRFCFTGLL
jgi:hypothetical protein